MGEIIFVIVVGLFLRHNYIKNKEIVYFLEKVPLPNNQLLAVANAYKYPLIIKFLQKLSK